MSISTTGVLPRAETAVPKRAPRRLPSLRRWISPVALVAAWQIASSTGALPPDKLSSPWTVLQAGVDVARSGELGSAFAVSLGRVGAGFALGALAGLLLADGRGASNGLAFETASTTALADPGKNSAIKDFVQRVVKAQLWSNSHPDEWARAWAAETGLKPEVAKKAVSAGRDRPIPLDDAVVASEQQLSDAFTNEGTLPGKVDFAAFVDRRYGPDIEAARRNG